MFGTNRRLRATITALEWDIKNEIRWQKHYRADWHDSLENNAKLRALNEKLYNAIDKKNAKIRVLEYRIANPGSDPNFQYQEAKNVDSTER